MSQPVPVLFLYPTLEVGGAERQLEGLVRRLDRSRFRPIVAVQHARGGVGDDLIAAGVPVHALSDRRRFDPAFPVRTWRLMRRERVRLVLTHGFSTGFVARWAAVWSGVPVRIVAEHTTDERDMNGIRHALNRLWIPRTSAWVAVTKTQREYLTRVKHVPEQRLHVIANGIDVARYASNPDARRRVREELGLPENVPVAGCIAVLRPEKDVQNFVRAAEVALRGLPEAHFVIVGDGPERQAVRREIVARDLEGAVTCLGFRTDVADVLNAFDVSVLSSTVEALPVAFLESMACGLPLVGTRVGALPELVEPGVNGLLVPPRDAAALGEAMVRVLRDSDKARRWGAASLERVRSRYDVSMMARAYEKLFTACLRDAGVDVLGDRHGTTAAH